MNRCKSIVMISRAAQARLHLPGEHQRYSFEEEGHETSPEVLGAGVLNEQFERL